MGFISRLKQLRKGTIRLLVFTSISLSLLLFIIGMVNNSVGVLVLSLFSFFVFWIIVRAMLWIQDGYKEDGES